MLFMHRQNSAANWSEPENVHNDTRKGGTLVLSSIRLTRTFSFSSHGQCVFSSLYDSSRCVRSVLLANISKYTTIRNTPQYWLTLLGEYCFNVDTVVCGCHCHVCSLFFFQMSTNQLTKDQSTMNDQFIYWNE